jgi:hypothetical protein
MKLKNKKLTKSEGTITLLTEFAKVHIKDLPNSYFSLFHKENNCSLNNSNFYKYTEHNYFYDKNDKTAERKKLDPKPAVFKLANTEHEDLYRIVGKDHGLIMQHGTCSSFRFTKSPLENCFRIEKESGEVLCMNKTNEPLFMNPNVNPPDELFYTKKDENFYAPKDN